MYSYEDRVRAVELYLKLGQRRLRADQFDDVSNTVFIA